MKTAKNNTRSKAPSSPYSFVSRFGIYADAGTTTFPRLITNHYAELNIKPQIAMFIVHIYDFKWDSRSPYPSLEKIADLMGVSRRMVNYYLETLKKMKLVVVSERFDQKLGQLTNVYDFTRLVDKVYQLETKEAVNAVTTAKKHLPLNSTSTPPLKSISNEEEEKEKEEIKNSNVKNVEKRKNERGGSLNEILASKKAEIKKLSTTPTKEPTASLEQMIPPEVEVIHVRQKSTDYKPLQPLAANTKLEAVADEISRKIGDIKHLRENRKQIKNLFAHVREKMSEADFIDFLFGIRGNTVEVIDKLDRPGAFYFSEVRKRLGIEKSKSP